MIVEGRPLHLSSRAAHRAQADLGAQRVVGGQGEIRGEAIQHQIVGPPQAGVEILAERLVAETARTEGVRQVEPGGLPQLGLGRLIEHDHQTGQLGNGQFGFVMEGIEPADEFDDGRGGRAGGNVGQGLTELCGLQKRMLLVDHRAALHDYPAPP